jgi:hypothetical protein
MLLSLVLSLASAQTPIDLSQLMAGQGMPGLTVGPKAEVRWLVGETASTRFPGDAAPGPTFAAGEMVEVIVVEGATTRVRKGDRYGWVANAALTMEAPAAPAGDNPLLGSMPPLVPAGGAPPRPPTP